MAEATDNCAKEVKIYGLANETKIPCYMKKKVKALPLKLLARGSTCCCYRIDSDDENFGGRVLKEFAPWGCIRKKGVAVVKTTSNADYEAFLHIKDSLWSLDDVYSKDHATHLQTPELYETSLGKCYLYPRAQVEMLSEMESPSDMEKRLIQVLRVTVLALNNLEMIHKADMVHLDMKSQNTCRLFIDNLQDYRCRSIDLGSCMTLPPEKGWSKLTSGDFASSEDWYPKCDINMVIGFLQDYDGEDDEIKKNALRWLDLKACMKMMFELLLRFLEYVPKESDTPKKIKALLEEFFFPQSSQSIAQNEVIHYLDIYARLCAIVDRSFRFPYGKEKATFYPLSEFRLDLYRLLAILGDDKLTPDEKEEKDAVNRDKLIHDDISVYCTELLKNREKNQEWSFGDVLNDYEDFINNPNTKLDECSVAGYYKHLLIQYL